MLSPYCFLLIALLFFIGTVFILLMVQNEIDAKIRTDINSGRRL